MPELSLHTAAKASALKESPPAALRPNPERHLRISVDEGYARVKLGAGRTMAWHRWRARRRDPLRAAKYPQLECVWLPAYRIAIPLESAAGLRPAICCVEARSGTFTLTDMDDALTAGAFDGEYFDPLLGAADAEAIARRELLHAILRRRGRAGKPTPGRTESIELIAHPYWVYYFLRGRHIDIRVLDAVSGQIAGNKLRLAVLEAFRTLHA